MWGKKYNKISCQLFSPGLYTIYAMFQVMWRIHVCVVHVVYGAFSIVLSFIACWLR